MRDPMTATAFDFDNSYRRLPERFHATTEPTPVASPRLIAFNRPLAEELGLHPYADDAQAASVFAGNRLPSGAEPIAMAYAGHQFGHFVPQLGDGRAILLGEVVDRRGQHRDIQLKGAGRTRFSRGGDGRAALGPVLREYLVSEAMHALGVPTTRSLAAVTTGEPVLREQPLPGAVLTRVAASHIRVGTFQYFAAREDVDGVRRLADYAIARHYPHAAEAERPYLRLLQKVMGRQAFLIARWMHLGFVHGVMNTDNMTISGETIDYGPCAFLDAYVPERAFSSIDHGNRYAYANQPAIAQWNLARLAECLLPLIDPDKKRAIELATQCLNDFSTQYREYWLAGMRRKLGLSESEDADAELADTELVDDLLKRMREAGADFTWTFRRLSDVPVKPEALDELRGQFADVQAFDAWAERWQRRLERDLENPQQRAQRMRATNPAFIPRNHRVEEAIRAALEDDDFEPFRTLHRVLAQPYDDQPEYRAYADPPPPSETVYRTFCGT